MGALLKIALFGALLPLLGERIANFCQRSKIFNDVVENVDLPGCQLIKGMEVGSEDIDVLPNGLAFISTGIRFPNIMSFAPDKPGEIVLLDLEDGGLTPTPLRLSKGFDASSFNPHGLSTYIDEDGTVYLFVVNHPHSDSVIEIFKFIKEENSLLHVKSIKHQLLNSVNDLVAVGPESFYATNDHYFSNKFMKSVEFYLGLSFAGIVYYSPGDVRYVVTNFYSGNGITISTDKKYIYAVDLTAHTIHVYEKNKDWSLSPIKAVDLDTIVDNLSVDPVTGDIWTGAHPNLQKLLNYKAEDPPGSEVIRVQNIHSDNPIITRVYVNNGSVIQGSSCASVYKGQLLVGTVFHRALHCPLQ